MSNETLAVKPPVLPISDPEAQPMIQDKPAPHESACYRSLLLKVTLHLAPLLLLAYIINYTDRVNVGIAKLEMVKDLSFSNTAFGLGMGLYFIGYSVFDVPSTIFFHRTGARIGLARTMICWGIVTIITMFVHSTTTFYFLRFLLGAAEAGFLPGMAVYLTAWFPQRILGTVMSIMISGALISGIIVGPLSGFILQTFQHSAGLHSWQWLFLLEGLPAVLLGIGTLFMLDDDPMLCTWLNDPEKKLLAAERRPQDAGGEHGSNWTVALKDRNVWFLGLNLLVLNLGIYSVVLCMPDILAAHGGRNLVNIGVLSSLPYVVGLVALPLVGIMSDMLRERRWSVFCIGVIGACLFAISVLEKNHFAISFSCLTLSSALLMAATPLVWAFGASLHKGEGSAASVATINMVSQFGGFLGPFVFGKAQDMFHSSTAAFMFVTFFVLAGSFFVLLVPDPIYGRTGRRQNIS